MTRRRRTILRDLRNEIDSHGWGTRVRVANYIEMDEALFSKCINGNYGRNFTEEHKKGIARFLGKSVEELFT